MSKGKLALGALVSAAAGFVTGILTAPKSGKETRADIKAKADEMKSEADKKARELKKQADSAVKDAKRTVEDYRGRAERAVNSAKAELSSEDQRKKS